MTYRYDLLREPWVPCLRLDGTPVSLGLRDTLVQAHELREVHGESPLVSAVLHRLLLAVLHRVYGPEDVDAWADLWTAGAWEPGPLDAYLDAWRERFDLFHPQHPFLQQPDERVSRRSVARLLPHVASGNNPTLFSHHVEDGSLSLSPAEAARALVTAHSFGLAGLSGLKQKFTDGTCARGVLFHAAGDNLFQTLALNLVRYPWPNEPGPADGDCPAWECDDPTLPERDRPRGYLDLLTWPNRRILLFPEEGPCVREVTMAPALRLDADVANPAKCYRYDERRGYLALRFSEERALWRDSALLLRLSGDGVRPSRVLEWLGDLVAESLLDPGERRRFVALGMANSKAKVEFYREERLPLPMRYLARQELVEVLAEGLQLAEDVARALWVAGRALARLTIAPEADLDGREPSREDLNALTTQWAIERSYWSGLELPFREWMEVVPDDAEGCRRAWRRTLTVQAWRAFDAVARALEASPRHLKAVVRGREALARRLAAVPGLRIEETAEERRSA